jgi:hypothetical protein
MALLFEAPTGLRLWIFLSRKDENDVALLVFDRHSGGERILTRRPPHVNSRRLINPGPRHIERLVAEDLEHA